MSSDKNWDFQPPVFLGGFFGKNDSDDESGTAESSASASKNDDIMCPQQYETRVHQFPGQSISIREVSFHHKNANFVWPGARHLAGWLVDDKLMASLKGKRVFELGAATGCLSIFLAKLGIDVTTSDYDDAEITENIEHNFTLNSVAIKHIPHTWGSKLDALDSHMREHGLFDVIIASDIMNYEKAYPELVQTLARLFIRKDDRKRFLAGSNTSLSTALADAKTSVDSTPSGDASLSSSGTAAAATVFAATTSVSKAESSLPAIASESTASCVAAGNSSDSKSTDSVAAASDRADSKLNTGGSSISAAGSDKSAVSSEKKSKQNSKSKKAGKSSDEKSKRTAPATAGESLESVAAAGPHHMVFYMSWQRRHKHKPEETFFALLKAAGGFRVTTRGQRVYEIYRDGC